MEGKQKFSAFDSTGIQPAERFWRFVAAFHFLIKHPKTDAHMCAYTHTHTFTLPHKLADAHEVWGGGGAAGYDFNSIRATETINILTPL